MTDLSKIKAEMGHYSSVVGNSVHLIAEDGRMIGQIAILCHTDDLRGKDVQTALCERIVQALDLDELIAAGVREGLRMGVEIMLSVGDSACAEALVSLLCCSGHHCGCHGASVGDFLSRIIRNPQPAAIAAAVARVKGGE